MSLAKKRYQVFVFRLRYICVESLEGVIFRKVFPCILTPIHFTTEKIFVSHQMRSFCTTFDPF